MAIALNVLAEGNAVRARDHRVVLGIDIGLTTMKVLAFRADGSVVGQVSAPTPDSVPLPHHVERDPDAFWDALASMVGRLCRGADLDVAAVAVAAHGDGLWLVDDEHRAVRPGILSLDTRARAVAHSLRTGPARARLLAVTGQHPWPASPGTLLRWVQEHEPASLSRARWALSTKDYVRLRLTGTVGTDATEASASFTDVQTQTYSDEAFSLYGVLPHRRLAPPISLPTDVIGRVVDEAALRTGLAAGTPVVAGVHDVDAGALGAGALAPGQMVVIAGSFSINQVISDEPRTDPRWCCRSFVTPRRWLNMAVSPASSANLEWFVRTLAAKDAELARSTGADPYAFVDEEVATVDHSDDVVTVLPYLYGSPHDTDASGAYVGLRAWHTRGHLLRGLYEGIAFNHRSHIDDLLDAFDVSDIRVMGGVARSRLWPQIFADTLDRAVVLPETSEPGALGAAMCAAVGARLHPDLDTAVAEMAPPTSVVRPDRAGVRRMARGYGRYRELVSALEPWWSSAQRSLPTSDDTVAATGPPWTGDDG